jgi:hypothetical protein
MRGRQRRLASCAVTKNQLPFPTDPSFLRMTAMLNYLIKDELLCSLLNNLVFPTKEESAGHKKNLL